MFKEILMKQIILDKFAYELRYSEEYYLIDRIRDYNADPETKHKRKYPKWFTEQPQLDGEDQKIYNEMYKDWIALRTKVDNNMKPILWTDINKYAKQTGIEDTRKFVTSMSTFDKVFVDRNTKKFEDDMRRKNKGN